MTAESNLVSAIGDRRYRYPVKVAAAQISCALGEVGANTRKVREFAGRAKKSGAELVVFPEMVDTGYSMPVIQKHATPWNDGAVRRLEQIAQEFSIAIICGMSEREEDRIYNSQLLVNANGEIAAKYRKTHLVTVLPLDERPCFTAGSEFVSASIDRFTVGLSICYDLRFPEVYRALAVGQKANVMVNSSAWPFPRVEHLRILALARAIENQSYLILANRVGTDDGVTFCGNSAIIDPYGVIVSVASADREELIFADLSTDVIASVRNRMKAFEHRRTDLY